MAVAGVGSDSPVTSEDLALAALYPWFTKGFDNRPLPCSAARGPRAPMIRERVQQFVQRLRLPLRQLHQMHALLARDVDSVDAWLLTQKTFINRLARRGSR